MKVHRSLDRKNGILTSDGSENHINDKENEPKFVENNGLSKLQNSEEGPEGFKMSKTRTSFKGSENTLSEDNPEEQKPEQDKKEQPKADESDASSLSYGYYDTNGSSQIKGNTSWRSRNPNRRKGANYYNRHSLYPSKPGKRGSFMEKIPEYKLYESVHKRYDNNNSFLSTEYNPADENMAYDRSQHYDDSYVGENTLFISDEIKLPTYIISFIAGFISVILVLCVFIYIWTKFGNCLGLRKKSSKGLIKSLSGKGDVDVPCMAEKRENNPNLTKIEHYISGPKAGSDDDDDEKKEGEKYNYVVNGEGYIDYEDEDDDDSESSLIENLFDACEKIKKSGINLLNKLKGDIGGNDEEKPLMEDNDNTGGPSDIENYIKDSNSTRSNNSINEYNHSGLSYYYEDTDDNENNGSASSNVNGTGNSTSITTSNQGNNLGNTTTNTSTNSNEYIDTRTINNSTYGSNNNYVDIYSAINYSSNNNENKNNQNIKIGDDNSNNNNDFYVRKNVKRPVIPRYSSISQPWESYNKGNINIVENTMDKEEQVIQEMGQNGGEIPPKKYDTNTLVEFP